MSGAAASSKIGENPTVSQVKARAIRQIHDFLTKFVYYILNPSLD